MPLIQGIGVIESAFAAWQVMPDGQDRGEDAASVGHDHDLMVERN
jgi:hypothetical protein